MVKCVLAIEKNCNIQKNDDDVNIIKDFFNMKMLAGLRPLITDSGLL